MSPPAGLRKRKGSTPSASAATAAAAPSPTLGRGSGSATTAFSIGGSGSANTAAFSLGRGSGSASTGFSLGGGGASTTGAFSLGPGGGSAAATVRPNMGGLGKGAATAPSCIDVSADGFPFPPSTGGASRINSDIQREVRKGTTKIYVKGMQYKETLIQQRGSHNAFSYVHVGVRANGPNKRMHGKGDREGEGKDERKEDRFMYPKSKFWIGFLNPIRIQLKTI